jgi:hypothetical protein
MAKSYEGLYPKWKHKCSAHFGKHMWAYAALISFRGQNSSDQYI